SRICGRSRASTTPRSEGTRPLFANTAPPETDGPTQLFQLAVRISGRVGASAVGLVVRLRATVLPLRGRGRLFRAPGGRREGFCQPGQSCGGSLRRATVRRLRG